jgi:NAD(P)H-nitrite reductase large subunit
MDPSRNGDRLLCHCLTVTWADVEKTVREHRARTVKQVTAQCRAGGGCRSCHPEIEQIIARVKAEERGRFKRFLGGLFPSRDS